MMKPGDLGILQNSQNFNNCLCKIECAYNDFYFIMIFGFPSGTVTNLWHAKIYQVRPLPPTDQLEEFENNVVENVLS